MFTRAAPAAVVAQTDVQDWDNAPCWSLSWGATDASSRYFLLLQLSLAANSTEGFLGKNKFFFSCEGEFEKFQIPKLWKFNFQWHRQRHTKPQTWYARINCGQNIEQIGRPHRKNNECTKISRTYPCFSSYDVIVNILSICPTFTLTVIWLGLCLILYYNGQLTLADNFMATDKRFMYTLHFFWVNKFIFCGNKLAFRGNKLMLWWNEVFSMYVISIS